MLPRSYYTEQDLRKWQIDTLKIFNNHVSEIQENDEYRVDFVAGDLKMSLNIILGPEFPNEKPTIIVSPPVQHPWVAEGSNHVLGAPGLLNFTVHSDLGRVVQAIIREFQKSIPNMAQNNDHSCISPQHQPPSMFPELCELTIEELQEILENTDLQEKIVQNTPQLIELELETEELMNNIETIAQDNISKQQDLENTKTDIIEKISNIVQMKINFEELNRKHQKLSEIYDPHHIKDCLKEAALQADEGAEELADKFLCGDMAVDVFVTKFAEVRSLGLARRAREERLAHQLAQLDRATL